MHGGLRHVGGLGDRATQKHFTFIFSIDHGAQGSGHAIAHDHVAGNLGGTLKVVAGARGHLLHEHFFGNAATKQHADLVQHVFTVVAVAIALGQAHGDTQGTSARNDGDLVHRIALGQQLANEGVTRLVISRVATLVFRHDHALALRAHEDFVFGFFKVLHFHNAGVASCRHEGRFVAQVGQIGTAHARCTASDDAGVHVLADWDFAHVHSQDLFAAANVGQGDINLAVKTTGAQKRCIQDVGAVGGSHHNHAEVGFKAVHLDQHLVEGLLAFVVATAQTSTTLAADCVNLVDKNNARRIFLGVLEHVSNTGCAHTHKHFYKV